jgi:hypothetical protein
MIDTTEFSPAEPERGLSSFANLLLMILGFDETQCDFSYANYLSCLGLLPGSAPKPTHPFFFPTGFPSEGPPTILPAEIADRMEEAFAELREIRSQLAEYDRPNEVPGDVADELGPRAMAAVRRLGAALGYRRWDSGETMVQMLQLDNVLQTADMGGAELVQAVGECGSDCCVWEDPEESDKKIRVGVLRLVFRLPVHESIENTTPATLGEWRRRSKAIAAVHNALFPGHHCIIEFRDYTAATVLRSEPIGPSYAEVVAKREAMRSKPT